MRRLYHLRLKLRWAAIAATSLVAMPPALWTVRETIGSWAVHFSWTSVRYAIVHHRLAAIALAFCIGLVTVTLMRHSWHMLRGLSAKELEELRRATLTVRDRGPAHPLWRVVVKPNAIAQGPKDKP